MVVKSEDWIGRRFGRLVIISLERIRGIGTIAICQCDCGNKLRASRHNLKGGSTTSCGCYWKSTITTHGKTNSRVYVIWKAMRTRCNNPERNPNHGGRGIKVCDRWNDSFENFYADMGDPPPKYTLERIDNNGNYEPGNCRWATYSDQLNNRRNNHRITAFGETKTLTEWCKEYELPTSTLKNRIYRAGMSPEDALSMPLYYQQRGKLK